MMTQIQRDISLDYTLCHQVTRLGAQRTFQSNGLDPEGQVPMVSMQFTSYALLGSGRVARHLQFYLQNLNLPVLPWSRKTDPEFQVLGGVLDRSSHVLLAVSDPAIEEMAGFTRPAQTVVHFSGSARVPGVFAAHPLMTFGAEVQAPEWYQAIPFVVDKGVDFSGLLPGLPNAAFALEPQQRALYHALCSLAGNSTFLLWQKIAQEFEGSLSLPGTLLAPFLHQVVSNALHPNASRMMTGPVARQDWATVDLHLNSLADRPQLQVAYRQFLNQAAISGQNIPEALL